MTTRRALVLVVASGTIVAAQPQQRPTYETILRRGTIVDGSGGRPYQGDVGIHNGHIARIGNLANDRAVVEIDVTGLVVAPGFINIHSHASPAALPTAENMLTQGVTTEILNPDGGGAVDIVPQLTEANAAGLAVNIGAYIGFNSVWAHVMGAADRRATPENVEKMRALVISGLEHGAWGVSAGLDYKPAYFAQVDEVVRVVDAATLWRTNFTNHDRLTPESNFSSKAGVGETIAIGEQAGLVPVVTHMKAQGREQGTAGALLAMMQQATARGHDTAADVYPYLAGQTSLAALIIPAWAQDGGREAMLARFKDPAQRARIVKDSEQAMDARFGGPGGIRFPATQRKLVDIMREQQASAGETVVTILEREDPAMIASFGAEPDLVTILQHPTTAIACDCGATTNTRQHPRAFGSFPRVLGRYVREMKALTLEDAVRKMTALPAATIGMVDRGFVTTGMAADLAVFDPATIADRATYEEPGLLSEGIRLVLVNGMVALRDGKVTGLRAGRVLSRTPHMPSRPMVNRAVARRLSLKGTVTAQVRVDIDVTQDAGATRARGSFRLADANSNTVLEGTEMGVLQTMKDWATFTARIRNRLTKAEGLVTVIVERADPSVDGRPPTVSIAIDTILGVNGTLREPASAIVIR